MCVCVCVFPTLFDLHLLYHSLPTPYAIEHWTRRVVVSCTTQARPSTSAHHAVYSPYTPLLSRVCGVACGSVAPSCSAIRAKG